VLAHERCYVSVRHVVAARLVAGGLAEDRPEAFGLARRPDMGPVDQRLDVPLGVARGQRPWQDCRMRDDPEISEERRPEEVDDLDRAAVRGALPTVAPTSPPRARRWRVAVLV